MPKEAQSSPGQVKIRGIESELGIALGLGLWLRLGLGLGLKLGLGIRLGLVLAPLFIRANTESGVWVDTRGRTSYS